MTKKPTPEAAYTKDQLLRSTTLGLPRDALMALLDDTTLYTKTQAKRLVANFLKKKV